ncbi:MAG: hypothetical protein LBP73_09145 [Clostridiales Family XIII bacterium]|jgi:hypothetical protein|nr:hypothetical protein [Clostridiales Family XIII bacterium]
MVKIFNRRFAAALLSVAMAAILLAGFGTPAWAAGEDITVNVQMWIHDEYVYDVDVTIDPETFDISDTYGWPGTLPTNNCYGADVVQPANRPTVLDATWIAFDETGIFDTVEASGWGWDKYPEGNLTEWRGIWVDGIFGYYAEEDPIWSSSSHWAGYAWTYTIDGIDPELYSSNIELTDGMTITWNYAWTEADIA